MRKIKVFIVSSGELTEERKEIALFLYRENKPLVDKDIFLDLVIWEELLHSFRGERIQDYFNEEMLKCDIVIALFYKKVGQFSKEEFDLAYRNLRNGKKPSYLFVYFKEGTIPIDDVDDNVIKVRQLKEGIKAYQQIYSSFDSIQDLSLKLKRQFDHILPHYVHSEALQEISHAKDSMMYSGLAPAMSYEEIQSLYDKLEKEAITGNTDGVQSFTHFLQKKYFPFFGECSKRENINYVTFWDNVFRKGGALSQIEANLKTKRDIKALQEFKHSMMFSKFVPVQSFEQYQNEYERLERLSIEGGIKDFNRLMGFLRNDYFPFMKAYMGAKNKDYIAMWNKVFGENGTISRIEANLKTRVG